MGRRSARPGRRVSHRNFRRLRFYPAFWERALPVQGVKYTFVFLANFTPINPPLFQNRTEAGYEGQVHRMFERVVFVAEAFIGAPVHALFGLPQPDPSRTSPGQPMGSRMRCARLAALSGISKSQVSRLPVLPISHRLDDAGAVRANSGTRPGTLQLNISRANDVAGQCRCGNNHGEGGKHQAFHRGAHILDRRSASSTRSGCSMAWRAATAI